jgi:hypothetical protein
VAHTLVTDSPTPTTAKGLPARIAGVIFAPRATYAEVAARPRVLGVLVFVVVVAAAGVFAFMSTEVGQNAFLDAQVQQREAFGRPLTEAQYAQLERFAPYARYLGACFQIVVLPLAGAMIAGMALAVFNAFLGGDGTFKHAFAVVAHSGVVLSLAQIFGLPLAYARQTMSSATNLAVFAPFLEESSFAARLLSAIDLFIVWWMISVAIGFGVLYRKRTGPIAATLLAIYVAIGIVIAAVKTAMSGA